MKLRNDGFRLN